MLGEKIKNLRKEKGITQNELAKVIGVSTSMIGMYEINVRKPSYDVLILISEYFNVSTDYLLDKKENSQIIAEKFDNKLGKDKLKQLKKESNLFETGEFSTANNAIQFILKQPVIMDYGDFDINKMSNSEIIQLSDEILNIIKVIVCKYKK